MSTPAPKFVRYSDESEEATSIMVPLVLTRSQWEHVERMAQIARLSERQLLAGIIFAHIDGKGLLRFALGLRGASEDDI